MGNRPKYTQFETTEDVGITNIEVNYLPGTNDDDRRLSINYSIGILEGYDGVNYKIIRRDNEEVIGLGDISDTIDSIGSGIYGGVYSKIINVTGNLHSSTVYYLEITPYYNDGVSNINLTTKRKRFSFTITEPVISITKSSDESNSIFDVEIILTDISNSMLGGGGQDGQQTYDYKIYKKDEFNEYEYIADGNIGELTTINNISCINGSCDFKIEYYVNIENTSTLKVLRYYEYQIECAQENDIITGNPTIAPTDNPGKIRIAFPDSFGIINIDRIGYTIYNSSLDVVDNNDNYTPVIWSTISDNNSIPYTEIPINFNPDNDNYRVQLQLYYEDELVGSFSLDYIKG